MSYSYSDIERANLKWFEHDVTRRSLRSVALEKGSLRGLKKFRIEFSYPFTAIAGKNGCGKSSLLAIAACAFHNDSSGWKLPDRVNPYYTFSDFFIQSTSDPKLAGIQIRYGILHDRWKSPTGGEPTSGLAYQVREKKVGGKWNDYDSRVRRPVAFFGIERVVPPSERSVFRSYRSQFSSTKQKGHWEDSTRECVARILGQPYEDFQVHSHAKYRLHFVSSKGAKYSGLNMGAGEKALFDLIGALHACPEGTLILVDEIELALHESAQKRLVFEISQLCSLKKIQVICTTHSPFILKALPPEGRFLVSPGTSVTHITPGVTAAFAAGRMGDSHSQEAAVYVEDWVARDLLARFLPRELLNRARIIPIGSHSAVVHQLAARLLDNPRQATIAIMDGDQQAALESHAKKFVGLTGGDAKNADWIRTRCSFLPGEDSPERWVLSRVRELSEEVLQEHFRTEYGSEVQDALDQALLQGDHRELYIFASAMNVGLSEAWRDLCQIVRDHFPDALDHIRDLILHQLKE